MRKPFNNNYQITQIFGVNPSSYAQFGLKGHNGIDYATPTGTPIVAPHGGKIIEAAFDATGYGMYVKIENETEGSVLAHFTSFNVNAGDSILEGQQIGLSGNTGNSTGPHLHWGYYRMPRDRQNGYAGFIDQTPFLNITPTPVVDTQIQKLAEEFKKLQSCEFAGGVWYEAQNVIQYIKDRIKERDDARNDASSKQETITNLNGTINEKNNTLTKLTSDKDLLADTLSICQFSLTSKTEQADKAILLQKQVDELEMQKKIWKDAEITYNKQISQYKSKLDFSKLTIKFQIMKLYDLLIK